MSKDEGVEPKKKKEPVIELDKDLFNRTLDAVLKMLEDNKVVLRSAPDGFGLGFKDAQYKKLFPDVKVSELKQVVEFVVRYVHYRACHDLDTFYDSFAEEKREKAVEMSEIVRSHKAFGPLAFRILRKSNYFVGAIESHVRELGFIEENKTLSKYYDISMPYIDGKGEELLLRLEIDRIELEELVATLAALLEKR